MNLNINPFEGDFGDGEVVISTEIVEIPKCHECHKSIKGKLVRRIEGKFDWDFEEVQEIDIFYWHENCWNKIIKEILNG